MKIVHDAQDVVASLRRGMSPVTDNRNVLLSLGFERAYPQVSAGYDSTIWERSVAQKRRADGLRVLARERAFLVEEGSCP
ncbi:MAG TPA: hypothetical protein VMA36_19155 [Candidatus Limnocylindria bacterium]|jgi:hypothetical protein|nr:hypothetical protein [Candidatus Limnocylindria bacterium]